MTVPGSNLLRQALSIQGTQPINYFGASTRVVNSIGVYVSAYAPPVLVYGSVQPVPRSLYDVLGLDLQKNYVTLYVTQFILDVTRQTQGDQFSWNGRLWQALSDNDWSAVDGWTGAVFVDVGADPTVYLSLSPYTDPGVTPVSNFIFDDVDFTQNRQVVVDVPLWTIGDAYREALLFSDSISLTDSVSVNIAIGGVQQGQLSVLGDGSGSASDFAPGPVFPGLNSYGVVAGGLRVQHNVRLTISCATVSTADIKLSRGVP